MWNFFKRNRNSHSTAQDIGPYSNYRMAVRLELTQRTGVFAQLANAMADEGASLGAVDIVSATRTKVIRDITVDVQSEEHGERVINRLNALPDIRVGTSVSGPPRTGGTLGGRRRTRNHGRVRTQK